MKQGDTITGKITGIEKYGIFLTFENGYTGLIHISELSNNYVKNVHDYGNINDIITCEIKEIDEKQKKLTCSIKNTSYGLEKDASINHGFTPLKRQLPAWISEKLKEIGKK